MASNDCCSISSQIRAYIKNITALSVASVLPLMAGCSDPNVEIVKNGKFDFDRSITVGEALENRSFCDDITWVSRKGEKGRDYVDYTCTTTSFNEFFKSKAQSEIEDIKEDYNFSESDNMQIYEIKEDIEYYEKEIKTCESWLKQNGRKDVTEENYKELTVYKGGDLTYYDTLGTPTIPNIESQIERHSKQAKECVSQAKEYLKSSRKELENEKREFKAQAEESKKEMNARIEKAKAKGTPDTVKETFSFLVIPDEKTFELQKTKILIYKDKEKVGEAIDTVDSVMLVDLQRVYNGNYDRDEYLESALPRHY